MIISLEENNGGLRRIEWDSKIFMSFIEEEYLIDMDIGIVILTWSNKQGGEHHVSSILEILLSFEDLLL